jgi:hypothetical protein
MAKAAKEAKEAKPGYKTTEFWLSVLACLLGLLMASGAIGDATMAAQIIGGVLALLSQLGYTASRTKVKETAAAPAAADRSTDTQDLLG